MRMQNRHQWHYDDHNTPLLVRRRRCCAVRQGSPGDTTRAAISGDGYADECSRDQCLLKGDLSLQTKTDSTAANHFARIYKDRHEYNRHQNRVNLLIGICRRSVKASPLTGQ